MEKYYLAALLIVFGSQSAKVVEAAKTFADVEKAYLANADEWREQTLLSEKAIDKFIERRDLNLPKQLQEFCVTNQVKILTPEDCEYPYSLKHIASPPQVLYVKGSIPNCSQAIGIVGSRKASPYGIKAAETFAADLATAGVVVVSGGAKGIDTMAHKGALSVDGNTIAVLGCGIDVVYPSENKELFKRIEQNGAVITEYPPGTSPLAQNFPARNRIINGIAQGILVVEAAKKSGAMITAEFAIDEGRDVYCVPGNIFMPNSIGCHSLIKQGAKLVDKPEDILEDLKPGMKSVQTALFGGTDEEPECDNPILNVLGTEPLFLEEILEKCSMTMSELSVALLELEFQGKVTQTTDRRYYRT